MDDTGFIENLLAGPEEVELSAKELSLLDAHLNQPISLATIQREREATGRSASQDERSRLKLIRDYNRNLQALQQSNSPTTTATASLLKKRSEKQEALFQRIKQENEPKHRYKHDFTIPWGEALRSLGDLLNGWPGGSNDEDRQELTATIQQIARLANEFGRADQIRRALENSRPDAPEAVAEFWHLGQRGLGPWAPYDTTEALADVESVFAILADALDDASLVPNLVEILHTPYHSAGDYVEQVLSRDPSQNCPEIPPPEPTKAAKATPVEQGEPIGGTEGPTAKGNKRRSAYCNEKMAAYLITNPSSASWTAKEWAKETGFSDSTICKTDVWKNVIMAEKLLAKAAREAGTRER